MRSWCRREARRGPGHLGRTIPSGYPRPIEERDDIELVRAAQAGDQAALERLLRLHLPRIHGLCRRMCGNDADAEDAAQEALISIVRGLPRFDGRSAFSTWVHRVATNACLDELRRRSRRPRTVIALGSVADPTGRAPALDLPDPAAGADERVPERLALDEALEQLPEEFRIAVVLRDHLGLDYAEIAAVLDLPPGTVRSRIARGRARLADALDPPSPEGNSMSDDGVEGGAHA